jgi:ABC-2 type transport system permease protein
MRIWSIFRKTLVEQVRDYASLLMVIVLCPFFVFLYWAMTGGGSTSYRILVMNQDQAIADSARCYGDQIVQALQNLKYPNGLNMLKVEQITDRTIAVKKIKDRQAAAFLVIPTDFSAVVSVAEKPMNSRHTDMTVAGDAANPAYAIASVVTLNTADQVIQRITGSKPAIGWQEELVGSSKGRTEFEMYVPGLLILAILMVIFTTALPLVREREERTLRRLRLSCTSSFDLLAGVSAAQIIIGSISVIVTFVTAQTLGFHSEGSLLSAIIIGILTVGSVVAFGLFTACFCKNATAVLTIGTFPFFILMWFTGAAMPLPRLELFSIGSRTFAFNDFLPPTHAVVAMNKVLSFGATLREVWPELAMILFLTVIYYYGAVLVFQRTQMNKM